MADLVRRFLSAEDGATAIEYALIATLVSVAIAASLMQVRARLNENYTSVVTGFQSANN